MSRLGHERAALVEADKHLRTAVYLIVAQEHRIARNRGAGLDTSLSEDLLCTMNSILRTLLAHREQIVRAIEAEQALRRLHRHLKTNGRLCARITLRPAKIRG
ncbi:hypothetical protein [Burkholderia territorii]|uniref:hypothetical protein n=1 Tax=Burkholderia territorii TaxID=1503055 RepID=UPI0009BD9F51|nr:hypothetical protein [Burkholderia territorii]